MTEPVTHRFGCYSAFSTFRHLLHPIGLRFAFNSIRPTYEAKRSDRAEASRFEPVFSLNFHKAKELQSEPCLFFHDEKLDRFLGGLRPGNTFFLYGSLQCLDFSLHLCVRAQFDLRQGGLGSEAAFIDAGNTFNPYLVAQYAEQSALDRDRVLDNIIVSRTFTHYQLTSLIAQTLPRLVHERGIKFIVVSDVIKLYRDTEVRCNQSLNLFRTALNLLVTTARAERAVVLATSPNDKASDSDRFLRAAKQRADIVLRFEERRYLSLVLEKHPTRSEEILLIKQPMPRVLEEYFEANANG